MKKLLSKIGHFFESLVNGAQRTWNRLEPDVRKAILQGSGIIALINKFIDKTPEELFQLLQEKFPDLPIDKVKASLKQISEALNLSTEDDDAIVLLTLIQEYLANRKGTAWAIASDTLAKIIAIALAPAGTKVATIVSMLWFAYHKYIKKDDD